MKWYNFLLLWLTLWVAFSYFGQAEAGRLRLGIMPSSDHWDNSKPYNEEHEGKFLELRIGETDWIGGLVYENSFRRTSNAWYWLRDLPINEWASWGYMVGGVTGYKDDRMMLHSAFTFTIHFGEHVKQRTIIIPFIVQGYQTYVEF